MSDIFKCTVLNRSFGSMAELSQARIAKIKELQEEADIKTEMLNALTDPKFLCGQNIQLKKANQELKEALRGTIGMLDHPTTLILHNKYSHLLKEGEE